MRLYIDSANIEKIKRINDYYPISGVTTNPSLLAKEGGNYLKTLEDIRMIIGDEKELFVQVLENSAEEIEKESHFIIKALSGIVVPKIPVTEQGIKAIKNLSKIDIPTLATTIYTPFQALVAAMSGAKYVAPYVNRIDNLNRSSINVVGEIVQLFKTHNLSCEVIGASFKNVQQVYNICLVGGETVTVSPDIIEKMVAYPSTSTDIDNFHEQWITAFGNDKTNLMNS